MRTFVIAVLIGIVCAMSLPEAAHASVLVRIELPTLVARSDTIVRGRVLGQRSRWDTSRRQIFTEVAIAVDERYKNGAAPEKIVVRHLGGTIDGVGMRTLGEVSFAPGEEVVLFLARSPGGTYRSVALTQGKLRVLRAAGQPPHVVGDLAGAVLTGPPAPQRGVRSLVGLAREIRALAARRR